MINITTRREKLQYQKDTLRQMILLERLGAKELIPILNRQFIDTASLLRSDVYNVNAPVNSQANRLYSTLYKQYRRAAVIFSRRSDRVLFKKKDIFPPSVKKKIDEEKDKRDRYYWLVLFAFIRKNSVEKTEDINITTKSILQMIINKGLEAGRSNREIAKDLVKMGHASNPRRAMRIARTETHTISVFSMDEKAISTGLVRLREWITARDERVRVSPFNHRAADGEKVGPREKFIMTGEPLDYPGDPSASPSNRINCRCLVNYIIGKKSGSFYNRKINALSGVMG